MEMHAIFRNAYQESSLMSKSIEAEEDRAGYYEGSSALLGWILITLALSSVNCQRIFRNAGNQGGGVWSRALPN